MVTIKIEGKSSLPAGFFLVPSKEKKVYTVIFEKLKEILGDTVVDTFHLDFEPGTLAACRNVFPDADIQGCNVHWKRCHRRRLDDLGLKSCSQNCPEVQTFFRKIWAIALVPGGAKVSRNFFYSPATRAMQNRSLSKLAENHKKSVDIFRNKGFSC